MGQAGQGIGTDKTANQGWQGYLGVIWKNTTHQRPGIFDGCFSMGLKGNIGQRVQRQAGEQVVHSHVAYDRYPLNSLADAR